MFAIPQFRIGQFHFLQRIFTSTHLAIKYQIFCLTSHLITGCIGNDQFGLQSLLIGIASHFHLYIDRCFRLRHLRSSDIERMTHQIEIRIGYHYRYITIKSATGIPTGIVRLTSIRLNGQYIRCVVFQQFGNVNFETHITVIGSSNQLTVQINITHIHDTFKVNNHSFVFP